MLKATVFLFITTGIAAIMNPMPMNGKCCLSFIQDACIRKHMHRLLYPEGIEDSMLLFYYHVKNAYTIHF